MFVSNIMGGTQMDDVVAANGIVKLSDQVISYVKSAIVTFLGHDMKEEAGERVPTRQRSCKHSYVIIL